MIHRHAVIFAALILSVVSSSGFTQQVIDGSFPFQSDPDKKYSLYIPSTYDSGTPSKLMLGFHPLNVARWNAMSWRDTLIVFSEENGLILACPDGGADGRVDDPIDLDFTTALLDSMETWYAIDTDAEFAMGFSWGGRATYRYGLANADRFAGFMPIGAAVNGTTEFQSDLPNAAGKPFYLVHGSLDATSTRFFPPRDSLVANGACVNWNLMPGVGHTIDFPNRNEILGVAFAWMDSVACDAPVAVPEFGGVPQPFDIFPNPAPAGKRLAVRSDIGIERIDMFDAGGRRVAAQFPARGSTSVALDTRRLVPGLYWIRVNGGFAQKAVIVR